MTIRGCTCGHPGAGCYCPNSNWTDLEESQKKETLVTDHLDYVLGDPMALSEEEAARVLLEKTTGLDVDSDHGRDTPKRFAAMLRELTTPEEFTFTTFPSNGMDEMITIGPIPFVSVCNHHVIPFVGNAWIGYVPRHEMAGLSKFARLVKAEAKSLQVQEQLTVNIADRLERALQPKGVAVVLKAEHFCMTVRGVQTPGVLTTTSAMRGIFADHDRTAKAEFLDSIR